MLIRFFSGVSNLVRLSRGRRESHPERRPELACGELVEPAEGRSEESESNALTSTENSVVQILQSLACIVPHQNAPSG